MFDNLEILDMPLSLGSNKAKVEAFLANNGLRLEPVDYYATIEDESGDILAGGGLSGDVIKCIAVSPNGRDRHLSNKIISHLIRIASQWGNDTIKVYTKPENRKVFESMGFKTIAKAPKAILMENGIYGINAYCEYLKELNNGRKANGAIVMNANPFTIGHLHLIQVAAKRVSWLYVIVVREEGREIFDYAERKAMIISAIQANGLSNVAVVEGSDYAVSEFSFPTYFLKEVTDATDTHITLDLDLFASHIAPALDIATRFVGSELDDKLTNRYNELMCQQLPECGIKVQVIERLKHAGNTISANRVRNILASESFQTAIPLVPTTTLPYLVSRLATQSLQTELDTTPKPGLIDRHDNGAHHDMDYALMSKSIQVLHPHFTQLALVGYDWGHQGQDIDIKILRHKGIEAEQAMLQATHGVNTHRGALFALGLTITVASWCLGKHGNLDAATLQQATAHTAQQFPATTGTHGSDMVKQYHVQGALDMAKSGYTQLFGHWLGLYRANSPDGHLQLFMLIMSELEDTNILHRSQSYQTLRDVQQQAKTICSHWDEQAIIALNERFIAMNISPGGSADMMALTLLIYSLLK